MLIDNIFRNHPNTFLIETGSYIGDGIQFALDAGFKHVISIELTDKYFQHCLKRFLSNDRVAIFKGDSKEILKVLLDSIIDERSTFWLDGHYSGGDTGFGEVEVPLMYELEHIKNHSIKTHTILIDDMRLWIPENKAKFGFDSNDIINKLIEINPNYDLSYETGFVPRDILVAKIK